MSLIRYPGSKDKIVAPILSHFPPAATLPVFGDERFEYREPFFGAGAVGFRAMKMVHPKSSVWLNDRDYGIACLWNSVLADPSVLVKKIQRFTPTVDAFFKFREEDGSTDLDPAETGFRKLALHQTSFSGLGVKAGGPIGGREQRSAYNVNCRWNATRLAADVYACHRVLSRFRTIRFTCKDFGVVIEDAPRTAFIYADPPYVEKGPALYKHGMNEADHRRLATLLARARAGWVLSYDDHPLVRELYSFARVSSVSLTYTMAVASSNRRKNSEVIIAPHMPPPQEMAV